VDNRWPLGGEIIRDVHYAPSLRKRPAERLLRQAVHQDGGPLVHNGSEEQQRSFDATCRAGGNRRSIAFGRNRATLGVHAGSSRETSRSMRARQTQGAGIRDGRPDTVIRVAPFPRERRQERKRKAGKDGPALKRPKKGRLAGLDVKKPELFGAFGGIPP
jgi:hypothetical protein